MGDAHNIDKWEMLIDFLVWDYRCVIIEVIENLPLLPSCLSRLCNPILLVYYTLSLKRHQNALKFEFMRNLTFP